MGGFSLVEALAAVGLLSIVVLGFAAGAERGVRYSSYNRNLATATTLAHDKIEELQSLVAATDPKLTAGTHQDALNPLTAVGTNGGFYNRSWVVTNNSPTNGLKTIVVTVTWSRQGENHKVRLVAVKS
jgi:type IV pilus assembly protein PilV